MLIRTLLFATRLQNSDIVGIVLLGPALILLLVWAVYSVYPNLSKRRVAISSSWLSKLVSTRQLLPTEKLQKPIPAPEEPISQEVVNPLVPVAPEISLAVPEPELPNLDTHFFLDFPRRSMDKKLRLQLLELQEFDSWPQLLAAAQSGNSVAVNILEKGSNNDPHCKFTLTLGVLKTSFPHATRLLFAFSVEWMKQIIAIVKDGIVFYKKYVFFKNGQKYVVDISDGKSNSEVTMALSWPQVPLNIKWHLELARWLRRQNVSAAEFKDLKHADNQYILRLSEPLPDWLPDWPWLKKITG